MKVSTVFEMRAMDKKAIQTFGIKAELLMENAGQAVYIVLRRVFGIQGKQFLLFCGTGNNGGDGCVVARKLHSEGGEVKLVIVGDPRHFKGLAKLNYEILKRMPIDIRCDISTDKLSEEIDSCDVIVDAMLGTGLSGDVRGIYREVIETINNCSKPVLSVDIPSGVQGDTGQVMGVAVKADYTVTFGLPKIGNMLSPGCERCGKLYLSHISLPPSLYTNEKMLVEINAPWKMSWKVTGEQRTPRRAALFIDTGFSMGMISYLKAGGKHLHQAVPSSRTVGIPDRKDMIVHPQKETRKGHLSCENVDALLKLSQQVDIVVLGPDLIEEEEAHQLVTALYREVEKPLLVIGGSTYTLLKRRRDLRNRKNEVIWLVEDKRLPQISGINEQEVMGDKVSLLQQTAEEMGAAMIWQGKPTLIGFPDRRVYLNLSGGTGLSLGHVAGTLAGTIAGQCFLGCPVDEAVKWGVFLQGLAEELAVEQDPRGEISMERFLGVLPQARRMIQEGIGKERLTRYMGAEIV